MFITLSTISLVADVNNGVNGAVKKDEDNVGYGSK